MRKYFLEDSMHPKGGISIEVKLDNDCVFCKHCGSIWWDYTNLIYMIHCDKNRETCKHTCELFEDDYDGKDVTGEATYKTP